MSPNGRYVVITDTRTEPHKVLIKDLQTEDISSIKLDDSELNWARWVTDERLVVSLIIETDVKLPPTYYTVVDGTRTKTMPGVRVGRMIAIDRDGTNQADMMSNAGSRVGRNINLSKIASILPSDPDHILMPAREKHLSLFKVNIHTGEAQRIEKGNHKTFAWQTNRNGIPVARYDYSDSREFITIYTRDPGVKKWEKLVKIRKEDREQFTAVGETVTPGIIYVSAQPDGHDRAALFEYDLVEKTYSEAVVSHPRVDISGTIIDGAGNYFASAFHDGRLTYKFANPEYQKHYVAVQKYFKNEANFRLHDVSLDGQVWVVRVEGPREPGAYYTYELDKNKIGLLAFLNPDIDIKGLGMTEIITYQTRDGYPIEAYFTRPPSSFTGVRPVIIMPHGGPQSRDYFGFDFMTQYLASRGYAVFQPNFRGSSGYGKFHQDAGDGEWAGIMQTDLVDGVNHLVATGQAQQNNVCIAGGSYGGYAALMGAILYDDVYKCAVSFNGVTDLEDYLKHKADLYGRRSDVVDAVEAMIGYETKERDKLSAISPLSRASEINIPLLLIHGTADRVVPFSQSEDMANAMTKSGKPVRFLELKGVNHSLIGYDPNSDEAGEDPDWYAGYKMALEEMDKFFGFHLSSP